MSLIEIKNLNKYYNANGITNIGLSNINLKLNKGEFIAVTGESGSGKSTLLNVISKIDNFDDGEILYRGNETSYFSLSDMDDFRKNKVGFIFQNYNIIDSYSVLENVMLPLLLKGLNKHEAKERAIELIKKVGLLDHLSSKGSKLSGGQKQRCVIARALASDCEILACDEPTGNLDSKTASEIIDLIHEIASDKLVLIVTHNYEEVEKLVTRQIKMSDGRIIEDIVYQEITDNEENSFMSLDHEPIKKDILQKIAVMNYKNTPKKAIFLTITFFLISFITCFVMQIMSGLTKQGDIKTSSYINNFESTIYVYDNNLNKIDTTLLDKYEYIKNPYAMETGFPISISDQFLYYASYAPIIPDSKIIAGRDISNDKEVMIALRDDDYNLVNSIQNLHANNLLNQNLIINEQVTDYKVVGFVSYHVAESSIKLFSSNFSSGCYIMGSLAFQNELNLKFCNLKGNLKIQNETYPLNGLYDAAITSDKIQIVLPNTYQNRDYELNVYYQGIYKTDNYEIIYDDVSGPIMKYGPKLDLNKDTYFAYVYAKNRPNYVIRKLEKSGLNCDYPCKGEKDSEGIMGLIMKILLILSFLRNAFDLMITFFITYFLLSRIYRTKIKDFEILRVLGICKKDMARLVRIEFVSLQMIVSVFSLIITYLLLSLIPALKTFLNFNIITIAVYFLMMFLFSFLMAKRFNQKIFRFTPSKQMRGSEEDD